MADVINVDWLNENAYRNYPLIDGVSRVAASGAVLPNGLLADLSMAVPLGTLEPANAFIRSVYGFSAGVVVTIGDTTNPGVDLATATIFTADNTRWKSYALVGLPGTPLAGAIGRITAGLPEAIAQCSAGSFDFSGDPSATRLVPSAIRPLLKGIDAIIVQDSTGAQTAITSGTLTLKAGPNVTLAFADGVLTVSSNVIATQAQITAAGCGCDTAIEGPQTPIKTINGIPPDASGNFVIAGVAPVTITPIASGNGIAISDDTATPCCGCDQLSELKTNLDTLDSSRAQMLQVADQLQARLSNLTAVILNAGLNPPSTPPATANPNCWWWLPIGAGGYGGVIVPCP